MKATELVDFPTVDEELIELVCPLKAAFATDPNSGSEGPLRVVAANAMAAM